MPSSLSDIVDRAADFVAGIDPPPRLRRQRIYLAGAMACVILLLLGFVVRDLIAGRSGEGMATLGSIGIMLGLIVLIRYWPRPQDITRFVIGMGLAMGVYETSIGSNGGFTFLWFYAIPVGQYLVLGRREGALWTIIGAAVIGYLLFVVKPLSTVDGEIGTLAVTSFLLLGILGHGLESARHELSGKVEREKEELQQALDQVETLEDLIPICASCKRARDDRGYWHQIEAYLSSHTLVELRSAVCPTCKDPAMEDSEQEYAVGSEPALADLPARTRYDEYARKRRQYFTLGMVFMIPLIAFFGTIDLREGRLFEVLLTCGLLAALFASLWILHTGRADRLAYQGAAAASLTVLSHELYVGAFQGFAVLWVYSFPAFTIFTLGRRGAWWTIFAISLTAVFVMTPIGYDYPVEMAVRVLAGFTLVALLSFGIEASRERSYDLLVQESEALRATLDQVQTLRGFLPICPSCKKVRDDEGFWELLEIHVARVAGPRFTHGLCPECAAEVLADVPSLQKALS